MAENTVPGAPLEGLISRQDMLSEAQRRAEATGGRYVAAASVLDLVERAEYWQPPATTTTVCCLILKSGFTVVESAACIDPRLFEPAVAQRYAYSKVIERLYQLLAFHKLEQQRPQ